MIIRRITEHLRQQNWVAVGLDLSVVILGVFLAFQVNEWKEARQSRADELVAIERLQQEASEIVEFLQRFVSEFERLAANQDFAVAALSENAWEVTDQEKIETGIATMVLYPAISPPRSTYDELVGSGRYGAISYPAVRKAISQYYADLDFVASQLLFFRQISDESMDLAGDGLVLVYNPDSDLRLAAQFDLETLASNRRYMSKLVRELRNQRMFQNYRRMLLGSSVAMCQALANVTDKPCPAAEVTSSD